MKAPGFMKIGKQKNLLLYSRWPWHAAFWTGYALFRFWPYYITVKYFPRVFLEYMLLSEAMFVCITYGTIWLYKQLFEKGKYLVYFLAGVSCWLLFLYGRTAFQFYYLQGAPGFKGSSF